MLYIVTNKIRLSTGGASFSVTISVPPEEIGYLQALHNSFKKMNMRGIPLADYIGIIECVQDEPQVERDV